jgi:hypothetical protein
MSAGVASNVQNATTIGKGATNMYVNGGSTGQNAYLLDGIAINNWQGYGGTSEASQFGSFAMPNPDAIAEFKIQTSTYDAGYGRNPGANVNVITKSGTNKFHGSAFEFFRNTALNANDWFLNRQGLPKPVLDSNVYGGAVGGPIKKDKLFFFVSYQGVDQKNGFSAFSDSSTILPPIPTGNRGTCGGGNPSWYTISACDAAGQAFVTALATNMAASNVLTSGSVAIQNPTACKAASNCDGQGLFNINPIAINLLQLKLPGGSYYVPGSGTSGYVPTNFVYPATFKDYQGIGNVDYLIDSKNTFSGRYIYEHDPTNGEFGVQNALEPLSVLPGVPITQTKTDQNTQAKLTSILSNTLVNEFAVAYQRDVTTGTRGGSFTNSEVGVQNLASPFTTGPVNDSLLGFSIGNGGVSNGLFSMGVVGQYGNQNWNNRYTIADQLSWAHRKHTIRVGTEVEFDRLELYTGGSTGSPASKSFADFLIGRAGCGAGLIASPSAANPGGCNGTAASNMSGSGGSANGSVTTNPRQHSLSAFIQDDFKVNERFTVNLGLRWELNQFPTLQNGGVSNFWPGSASPGPPPFVTAPGGAGESLAGYVVPSNYTGVIPAGVYQSTLPYLAQKGAPRDDFAPRIGFAWRPTSSNRLVLRGGAGYFYNLLSAGDSFNVYSSPPLHGSGVSGPLQSLYGPGTLPPGLVSAGPGYFGFSPLWVDLSTVSPIPAALCLKPPCSSNVSNASYLAPSWTVPVTYEWNMNTQWEFLPTWVLEVGYVGSHGIHQITPGAISGPNADGTAVANPYNIAQLVGVGALCTSCANSAIAPILAAQGNTPSNAILRVPYLGVSATATRRETDSNYKYNSLQVTLRKRLSKGLQVQAAYTWARAFEQAPQGINTYPYFVQTYSPEYGVRPQRLVVNFVWNLPLGNQKGFLGKVTENWSWSGVTVIQDGSPQDIVDSTGGGIFGVTSGLAATIDHAQLCPGMTAANIATSGSTTQRVTNGLEGKDGWINSAAFCAPPSNIGAINGVGGGNGFGNMGAGNILGPGQSNWDMSLAKLIKIRESQSLQFRAEFFNTFNHPQFGNINDTDAAGGGRGTGLGDITNTAVNPRVIQFALKYLF